MKTFRFIAMLVLVSVVGTISASDVWVKGYVISKADGKQSVVPFATISVYDYENTDNLKSYLISGINGEYMLRPYDRNQQHTFIVEAPGYKSRRFNLKEIPNTMNGWEIKGSVSVHIELERDSSAVYAAEKKVYDKAVLAGTDSINSVKQMLASVEELECDDNLWVVKATGESVCVMLNGVYMSFAPMSEIEPLPAEIVSRIEYYPLPEGGAYGAVVNLVIPNLGYESQIPPVELQTSPLVF